ncbi:hypothetical protein ADH76_27305 [Enterocloster clostridioformis]|nr:hypothetical protein A4V08_36955 [Lachnoclostridium sp. YL32]NDO32819.1 cyclic lactone autoinducer peptide [Enterocloster clostridioformis]OXE63921.1 hypothetical protein ADH76_27305 [Enterocloster clostridioformis]
MFDKINEFNAIIERKLFRRWKMDKVMKKTMSCIAALAYKTAYVNVNSCCMYVMHQPKVPKKVERLKKY